MKKNIEKNALLENEIGMFYDTFPPISLDKFVELMIASLASKSLINDYNNSSRKIAVLKHNYLSTIEDIMYQDNGWGIKFSSLINIKEYYDLQRKFENDLKREIQDYSEKEVTTYDFVTESIRFDLSKEKIEEIFKNYDQDILDNMDHFTNLLSAPCFDRDMKIKNKRPLTFLFKKNP